METLSRRNAMRGIAVSLTSAMATPVNALVKIPKVGSNDLAQLEGLIARWQVLEVRTEAKSKSDCEYHSQLLATAPVVPAILKTPILQRDGEPIDSFTRYKEHGYSEETLKYHITFARKCLTKYRALETDNARDIVAHQNLVLKQAAQRLKVRKAFDKAHDLHWAEYDKREDAWSEMVDECDEALQLIIAFEVTSPEALQRKASFYGSMRWFQENHNYETIHDAAVALVADVQRVAMNDR